MLDQAVNKRMKRLGWIFSHRFYWGDKSLSDSMSQNNSSLLNRKCVRPEKDGSYLNQVLAHPQPSILPLWRKEERNFSSWVLRQGTWSMQDEKVKVICWMLRNLHSQSEVVKVKTSKVKQVKAKTHKLKKWKFKLTSWKSETENSQGEKVKVKTHKLE